METALVVIHILVALGIIGLVLIQQGKGADAGAAFGAGAAGGVSGSVFGAKGSANFLSRSTALLATVFFLTSLSLAYLAKGTAPTGSLMDNAAQAPAVVEKASAPADTSDRPIVPAEETPKTMVTDTPENP